MFNFAQFVMSLGSDRELGGAARRFNLGISCLAGPESNRLGSEREGGEIWRGMFMWLTFLGECFW
jgi:hypothetical protein